MSSKSLLTEPRPVGNVLPLPTEGLVLKDVFAGFGNQQYKCSDDHKLESAGATAKLHLLASTEIPSALVGYDKLRNIRLANPTPFAQLSVFEWQQAVLSHAGHAIF